MRAASCCLALFVAWACSPEREAPAPLAPEVEAPRTEDAVARESAAELSRPAPRVVDREGLVPEGLAEFDIQALPAPLDELRDKAKQEIGPANADKELEKLRVELGERQP